MSLRSSGLVLAGVLALAGLCASAWRVRELERGELEHETAPRTLAQLADAPGSTRVSARIAQVALRSGEHVLFELCSTDRLEATRWRGAIELAVFHLPDMALMLRVPLDAAHLAEARRNAHGACLSLGGGVIEHAGEHSVDAVWPQHAPAAALTRVPIYARVLARKPLTAGDRYGVLAIASGIALALALAMSQRAHPAPRDLELDADAPARPSDELAAFHARSNAAPFAVALLALAAIAIGSQLPTPGALQTFGKGIGLASLQAGAALLLARWLLPAPARGMLALAPPAQPLLWSAAALAAGAGLYASATFALRYVPATGEAPIQTFVSWPSGMLCFAALGALLPVGEELFFRGYVYRAALAWGAPVAYFASLIPFVALHAQQSWGNWGALTSIGVTGIVLTGLRARSGSLLVPAIAHMLYNFALSMASF